MWIIEIIQVRASPGSMPTSLPSGCRFQTHAERTTGPGRWHRGRQFGKEVVAFLMMNEIVYNVLTFMHYEKIQFSTLWLAVWP